MSKYTATHGHPISRLPATKGCGASIITGCRSRPPLRRTSPAKCSLSWHAVCRRMFGSCLSSHATRTSLQVLQQPCYSNDAGSRGILCGSKSSRGLTEPRSSVLDCRNLAIPAGSRESPRFGSKKRTSLVPQTAPGAFESVKEHTTVSQQDTDSAPEPALSSVSTQRVTSRQRRMRSSPNSQGYAADGLLPEPHQHLSSNGSQSGRQHSVHSDSADLQTGSYSGHSETVRGLVYGATVKFSDSAALRLRRRAMVVWEQGGPKRVLIVKKPIAAAGTMLLEMADWLLKQGVQVFVEPAVHDLECPQFPPFNLHSTPIDFAVTLGGDGTVLHLASLFDEDKPLPPVMCFAMGTLGFLTPFDAASYRSCLSRLLAAHSQPLFCTLRTRKRCVVISAAGQQLRVHHILNECVIDRGACPSSVHLEIYIDGGFVTVAEADGLIVATPSGSTAYSMSAGGSMVAPSVPCTLLTPLSPHSLSFRPLIVPENADLLVRLPLHARSHARASFDGKHPMKIERGGSIHFTTSLCPLPLINIGSLDTDWYEGITHKLKWNQRIRSQGIDSVSSASFNNT